MPSKGIFNVFAFSTLEIKERMVQKMSANKRFHGRLEGRAMNKLYSGNCTKVLMILLSGSGLAGLVCRSYLCFPLPRQMDNARLW
jgi:hypothetical protein